MRVIFWTVFATLFWCYVGYPLAMRLLAAILPRPWRAALPATEAPFSVVLAVRNGAASLRQRVEDLLSQDCPPEGFEVIIVCNGCSDETEAIARELGGADLRIRVATSPAEAGKAGAINTGVALARHELVVFADVRQTFARDAVRRLLEPFGDPSVGAVTGRLVVGRADAPAVEGMRLYWSYETSLRVAEGRTGSVVGATGAIYAIRRTLFPEMPPGLILDDVYVPLRIALAGYRVAFAERALAFDVPAARARHEFERKRRTMVGNLQLIRLLPSLLRPRRNPMFVRFVSHKALRVASPVLCLTMLACAGVLGGPFYGTIFLLGVAGYLLGALGFVLPLPILSPPSAFVLMHGAVFSAFRGSGRGAAQVWRA